MGKANDALGFKDVLAELKNGKVRMLYVLEGEEIYLKSKLLAAIEKLVINPSSKTLDYMSYDFSNQPNKIDFIKIANELKTPSFLSVKRLIVIKNSGLFSYGTKSKKNEKEKNSDDSNADDNSTNGSEESPGKDSNQQKDLQKNLIELLDYANESACLIFIEDKIDKRMKSIIDQISEKGLLASITKPDIRDTKLWLKAEFCKNKVSISDDLCEIFIDRNDGDLSTMVSEIDKLSLYLNAIGKSEASRIDIDNICTSDLKGSIFDIIDALSHGDGQNAYKLLELLINQKQPVQLISFMIARQIKQLITAKEIGNVDGIIKKMRVIPFVANKIMSQSKKFSFETLEKLYNECFEMDIATKTSKINDRIALETLFANITEINVKR